MQLSLTCNFLKKTARHLMFPWYLQNFNKFISTQHMQMLCINEHKEPVHVVYKKKEPI